jgi:GNAT superfamily N-acetyltransferase
VSLRVRQNTRGAGESSIADVFGSASAQRSNLRFADGLLRPPRASDNSRLSQAQNARCGALRIAARQARRGQGVAITFVYKYAISRTMAFEAEYHPNLRLTLREKREMLKRAIVIWMLVDGTLVGETYGLPLDGNDMMPGCPRDPQSIYCYSTTILRAHQGRGYGSILKAAFIGRVSKDFRRVYGHARPGGSQALNVKFGARLGRTFRNWFETGEDYRVYVLHLRKK